MKKLLFILSFLIFILLSFQKTAQAQFNSFFPSYGYGTYGYYYPYYGSALDKAYYGTYQFFDTVNEVWSTVENSRATEAQIQNRRNNLENYKTLQRAQTEGIPPFADVGPDGKQRSPKITWQDVESIR